MKKNEKIQERELRTFLYPSLNHLLTYDEFFGVVDLDQDYQAWKYTHYDQIVELSMQTREEMKKGIVNMEKHTELAGLYMADYLLSLCNGKIRSLASAHEVRINYRVQRPRYSTVEGCLEGYMFMPKFLEHVRPAMKKKLSDQIAKPVLKNPWVLQLDVNRRGQYIALEYDESMQIDNPCDLHRIDGDYTITMVTDPSVKVWTYQHLDESV